MTAEPLAALIAHLEKTHPGFLPDALTALAFDIAAVGHERDDPVREIMARLGDRWSALLLFVLATGDFRHAALRRIISVISAEKAISQRMLTLRLRALERDGLVARETLPTVPPQVIYSLTALGRSLVAKLEDMLVWIKSNEEEILAARARFDS
jgi:DNA-binding HxlR family transcriptional regulator